MFDLLQEFGRLQDQPFEVPLIDSSPAHQL
jgi:hypothetical protein